MQRQRLFGAVVVVLVLGGLFLFFRGGQPVDEGEIGEEEAASVEEVTRELSTQLGVTVAEDVERIALNDVRGEDASGLATRNFVEGRFDHTALAALPDLTAGTHYRGWLVRGFEGDENYSVVDAGKLRVSKGGYLLEFSSSQDLSDHSQVWITIEAEDDGKPETRVLEGDF